MANTPEATLRRFQSPSARHTAAMDELVRQAVFGAPDEREQARWLIWEIGQQAGVRPASIHEVYLARGRGEVPLHAGFYNIAVDTSTLVDLSQPTLDAQQRVNYERAADLTRFIRDREPEGVTVSVGAEIGEVGGKNSDVHELKAFMDGYVRALARLEGGPYTGISKISVQTGTSHGGVVLPDGSIAKVQLDLDALKALSADARSKYGLGGA